MNTPRDGRSPAHEPPKIINAHEVGTTPEHRGRLHVGWIPQQCSDHAVYESVKTSPTKSEGSNIADRTYYNLIGRTLVPDARGRSKSVTGITSNPPDVSSAGTYQAGSGPL